MTTIHKERWISGSRFISEKLYNEKVINDILNADKESGQKGKVRSLAERQIRMGGCLLSSFAETEHGLIIGRPGVGKSVLTYQIVDQLIRFNRKAVVYDFKGDFVSKFYDPKRDIIFNPFDKRSVRWNIINEIKAKGDSKIRRMNAIESICHSLIPNVASSADGSNEGFFRDGARDVLMSLIVFLLETEDVSQHNNAGLIKLLKGTDVEIRDMVKRVNPIAANYISSPGSNQTAGVLAVLARFSGALQSMDYPDGNFTVNQWVTNERGGVLYVTGFADIRDKLRPILSLLIDTIALQVLSLPESLSNRLFFILDEFTTLQRLNSLVELLTLSRSKGGSIWLATQDLSQIGNIYGQLKSSIINACGTKVIFSVADPGDAKYFSEFIGEAEYLVETIQESGVMQGAKGLSDTDGQNRNFHRQLVKKFIALPSNIMNQKKFHFIYRSYQYPFVKSKVELKKFENKSPNLIMIDGENNGELVA